MKEELVSDRRITEHPQIEKIYAYSLGKCDVILDLVSILDYEEFTHKPADND